jgi:hypothetical protein
MNTSELVEPIPWEVALQLCESIRKDAEIHWDTAEATWCFVCQQQTGGDLSKRGILRAPGNRGCPLVNGHYTLWKQEQKNL